MADELRPGDPHQVGRYRLLGRLGGGGMGQVFLGRSPGGRLVAVKVVRGELAEQAEFRSRFAREVAAVRTVSGLFTAPVVDADPDAAVPWLATAYIPGLSLADTVTKHGPLPAASVLALAAGLAEGLGAIHAAGIVHRDLKPSNVLLAEDGPRIIDFGVSLAAGAGVLTVSGLVFGSPGFMSPEQAQGHRVGPASDVFSLGSVLTFAATGHGPFGTAPSTTLLYRVVYTPPDTEGLPAELRPLVERCLAKDPGQRPSTEQLLAELNAAPPAAGWLPAPITQTFPPYPQAGPAAPTAVDLRPVPGGPGQGRPGRSRLALAGAAAVAVALLAVYLIVAMTAHLPPFGKTPAAPATRPAPVTTAAPSASPRPSPATSSRPASPATSPVTTPATSHATSPATSPATSHATSPATSHATSPATSPATSHATSPATSPPASKTATSPPASKTATSPPASKTAALPVQVGLFVRHALHAGGGGVEQFVRQVGQGTGDGDLFSDHRHAPVGRIQLRLTAAREVTVISPGQEGLGVGLTIDLGDEYRH
jgi:eukaryotic-like serine/threonine-protein kinase